MSISKKIKSALISVYHKDNLDELVMKLNSLGVKFYSTGGTQQYLQSLGFEVTPVEQLTSYPSILGGRVKTLHPKVFGGILGRRDEKSDVEQMQQYEIPEIDLVIVDLYPFEETVEKSKDEQEIIEKIDIGGISLIRAAAKNFKDVLVVASKKHYETLFDLLVAKNGETTLEDRKWFAAQAFNITSHYDTAIFNWFNEYDIDVFKKSVIEYKPLRYGENPHQKGKYYGDFSNVFSQFHGKEISYNNLLDIDAAIHLISEFSEPTIAIIKHNNACGLASRANMLSAWNDALAGDPISAFGGIIVANRKIEKAVAEEINKLFFEVIIAPAYDDASMEILKQKKNRIILLQKPFDIPKTQFRSLLNGVIYQDRDMVQETTADMKVVTKRTPTEQQYIDMEFANKLVKHTKSNAIILAKNRQLLASGVGQTSRVDALKQAIEKAQSFGFDLNGAVMASDAFFPFADCVEIAYNAGITSVIQPGGSVKDKDSIDYCDLKNMAMVFTGIRHFKH